ncbi:MAG: glutamate synthase subunit alpha, partial [Oligoflexia bacterium]|nr:glutamate synthase subunit alpha [Oligoflexia bacterium]
MVPSKVTQNTLYNPRFEHDACGIGFVANIKGIKSKEIIEQGLTVLKNMHHRGATGSEADTGDGAGILIQVPHDFLKRECLKAGFELPDAGQYGVGMLFLPPDPVIRKECEEKLENIVHLEDLKILGWRTVPTDDKSLGSIAKSNAPFVRQIFIARPDGMTDDMAFERKLYVLRKNSSRKIRRTGMLGGEYYYACSMSMRVIVYKGMLTAMQIPEFYPELNDPLMKSAIVLVHARFSTNTFPSWERSHPYRYIIHNGEINTLRGNVNWFQAREKLFKSGKLGDDLNKVIPVLDDMGSDSAILDNCLEFLVMSGRPIEQAMMMMIPEPWQADHGMDEGKRAFYEFHSCLMEPWDGPAAVGFTDGVKVGAILDRNGLRPGRYYVTKDDLVVLASEVGVLDIPEEKIIKKGRLRPGKMFLVDTAEQRIVSDWEIKSNLAKEKPYSQWLKENVVKLNDQPEPNIPDKRDRELILRDQKIFGYTLEDLQMILAPMALNGAEPVGSMGNDIPLAVLSDKSCLLYDYFKQLFAQVTNPPVDSIREEIVMASGIGIGPEGDLLEPDAASCRQIHMDTAILSNKDLAKIRNISKANFKSKTISILFDVKEKNRGLSLKNAMDGLCDEAVKAVNEGYDVIILSDRGVTENYAPIPALLAVSGVHHHLIELGLRPKIGIVLESGEPREVHHFATLIGYGASGINPYLVFETLENMIEDGILKDTTLEKASHNVIKALAKGVIKTISKMGISTVESYCGAKTFEAVGIKFSVVDKYFTGTPTRIEGVDLDEIAMETLMRFDNAFRSDDSRGAVTEVGGRYKWRARGEVHQYNPDTILTLQRACRENDYGEFKKFTSMIDDENIRHKTLRGLITFRQGRNPIPLEKVEPVDSIVKRFKTGAMSYGSISQEAHESLAIAMNILGARSNSGEGGEDPERYVMIDGKQAKISTIKQVASGRFGVTSEYLVNAKELQIKVAQGAKPGEGGQLPG